nr:ORF2 [Torque teno Leptonychotes weddellii virus 1]
MCSTAPACGYPDLYHPLQYKRKEALWKRDLRIAHASFCDCNNFLDHFKWPTTGKGDGGDREDRGGVADASTYTGEDGIAINMDTGEKEEVSDQDLLQ